MESLRVVVLLDESRNIPAQIFDTTIFVCMDFFTLQSLHEALAPSVVPGIREATHTRDHSVFVQYLAVFGRGILDSTIGMMYKPWRGHPTGDCVLQGADRELRRQR